MSIQKFENMFRPANEGYAALAWFASAIGLMIYRPPFWPILVLAVVGVGVRRVFETRELWRLRISMTFVRARVIKLSNLIERMQRLKKKRQILSIGIGFQWTQKHVETAKQILNSNEGELPQVPGLIKNQMMRLEGIQTDERTYVDNLIGGFLKTIIPANTKPVLDSDIGSAWIHSLGQSSEEEIGIPFSALPGHTLITGTTRAGKTRLYEALTAQIVAMGPALIVIDPKKDSDWVSMLNMMCKKTGRKFLYFDPAQPAKSIRLQPLQNWNNISEPATRIGQLVDADGSFAAFAWKTIYRIHRALIAIGERPDIKNTKRYVQMGVEDLAEKVLEIYLKKKLGPEFDKDLPASSKGASTSGGQKRGANDPLTRLDLLIAHYMELNEPDDTADGIISMVKHSKEHYSKMVQVLEPILEMLGSDEIGGLLSPDPLDTTDKRPIYDMKKVIDERAVLYVGLDSLSNKTIASAIGSILLADLASTLGAIYNFSSPTECYLFVDEVAEVANDQLIQILNKGGGAGIRCFLAMQSVADLTTRLGSREKCEMVLANLNNLISLRVRSDETAEYVSKMFGEVQTRSLNVAYASGSESSKAFTEFRSSTSRSLNAETSSLVPPELLTRLPPLHYFAFIAGRGQFKGVIEFVEAKRISP